MITINEITIVRDGREIIYDYSEQIPAGSITAIVGPNGCGKSTLLNILGLLDNPSGGSYVFNVTEVAGLKEKQRTNLRKGNIGFVFQSFNLIDELTVYENIELPLLYLKMSGSERKKKVDAVMERMKIIHRKNHFPQQLSGGQQQRVAIARALAMRPKVMLLDEITSALDPEVVGEVLNVIRSLNKEHDLTMIMVTHQMGFAREISDRVCFFNEGKIFEQGPPEQLFDNPQNERTKQFLHAVLDAN